MSSQDYKRSKPKISCRSYQKIEFTTSAHTNQLFMTPFKDRFNIINGIAYLKPKDECTKCNQITNGLYKEHINHSYVITPMEIIEAKVFDRVCKIEDCGDTCVFEGSSVGLLNMGKVLIAHEILKRYLLSFVLGRYGNYLLTVSIIVLIEIPFLQSMPFYASST
jgi:hypothetical protein